MKKVIGPDISFYQDEPQTPEGINFGKMKKAGDFVLIRAGQNLWPDPDFQENWSAAKGAGLPRGSYWFYDSRAEPNRQADLWCQLLGGDFGELPLFADIEETYDGRYKGWHNWYDFLERLKILLGDKEIGIYTSFYYWRDHAPKQLTQSGNLEYFHRYPLWIANYGVQEPKVPRPWGVDEWLFWQFTNVGDGKAYGAESKGIDLNYFNGEVDAFRRRFGLPAPDPSTEVGDKYRIELSVREQPDDNSNSTGVLKQDDVIELLETTADESWIKIRGEGELSGWSRSKHLISVESPEPPEEEPTGDRYLVIATALNVRTGPGTSYSVVGVLKQDEIVEALNDTADPEWIKIRRADDLTGWSSRRYLVKLGTPSETNPPPATSLKENLFKGVDYSREVYAQPRKMVAHVLSIDLHTGGIQFLVTPPDRLGAAPLCTRTTSHFLVRHSLQIAINGDGFSYLSPATYNPLEYCRNGGDPVRPNGYAASRGKEYSKGNSVQPVVYIRANNIISFNKAGGAIYNAIAGDRMLVEKGKPLTGLDSEVPEPRTAIGINQNGRLLTLMVVDGRQPGYSEGATFAELANFLTLHGVYTGMSLDGGGSSTMVVAREKGQTRILNSPIDNNVPGRERAVANHLGIYIKR